jgi:predicted transcriptional regulator
LADLVPSERELDILKALWELGEASVREVHEKLCPQGELAFNTIQTMLRNMEEKGLVRHRSEGRAFIYYALYSREQVSSRFLTKVFDGALDQLVLSMLRVKDVSPDELKDLERLISSARRDKQNRPGEEGPP